MSPDLNDAGASARKALEHEADLIGSDGLEHVEAGGGEDLDRGEAAEVAPIVAVGGEDDGAEVVANVLARDELGPVGENDVIFRETLLNSGRGGDHHHEPVAEAEGEDGAEL